MSKAKFVGVFGRRNSGKSSLINTLSGEQVAIVSETPGTTTDPVKKRMEIFGIGPCVFIDTAGIDDEGDLGEQRIAKTRQVILQIDLAILLYTNNEIGRFELELLERFKENNIPVIIVHNQSDIISMDKELALEITAKHGFDVLEFSSGMLDEQEQKVAVEQLTALIVRGLPQSAFAEKGLFEGLVEKDDLVVLVVPIDSEAPEGRIILPQVNAIRDILDRGGVSVVLQPAALENYFKGNNKKVKLIVTDSQAFEIVSKSVPANIPLTGFSVLLARSKADFENYLKGTPKIDDLKDGDRILILESCSHHSSCDDIGRVKIPRLIMNRTGKKIVFDVVAGLDNIPSPIKDYALVVQCGGCMITQRQLMMRLNPAVKNSIPVTNYGMTIAWCVGIYERAIAPFLKQTE
jgi:[FeFe] hydrogenase H-cluster maturation GTPase HydF